MRTMVGGKVVREGGGREMAKERASGKKGGREGKWEGGQKHHVRMAKDDG